MTAFGMPFSRMSTVSARVSTPVRPTMPRLLSQASRWRVARQLDGSVTGAPSTTPRTPEDGGRVDALDVLLVRADIADVGEGEGDDLAGVGRVGQDLLIARHRGVEADLAVALGRGTDAEALEHGAVGEDEERGRARLVPPTWRACLAASVRSRLRRPRNGHAGAGRAVAVGLT